MSSQPQPMPQGRRAVDIDLPSPATLPLQLRTQTDVSGLVEYHPVALDYSSHLSHASLAHRRRPSLLSEFQQANERGQEPHIRYEHIYLHEHSSHSEVDYSEMKRPRLDIGAESLICHQTHRHALNVAGAEEMAKEHSSSSSIGKIKPISPVSPGPMEPDLDLVNTGLSKEELIQNMDRVDREITMVEQQICKLRKKRQQLEEEAAKPQEPERNISPPPSEAKHRSLVQIIYDENRTRVPAPGSIQAQPGQTAQVTLTKAAPVVCVPAMVSSSGVTTLPVTVAGISVAIGQAQKAGGQPPVPGSKCSAAITQTEAAEPRPAINCCGDPCI
ncbi:nuclear receptor corepressor 2-like [Triplophysa dalaica]|uniref:nuclear receptor corepressor 2-like n=1 Tax=Triplophysa dalaica TaxID=1582913 RepID=UPI0024E006C8|nr:nuclear receptor corepressor 2-like [Triplophysa dalaica]